MQENSTKDRQAWMGLLAKAPEGQIAALLGEDAGGIAFDWLRPPAVGSVTIRGRVGGTDAPFNIG